jgi:hypothetical protein
VNGTRKQMKPMVIGACLAALAVLGTRRLRHAARAAKIREEQQHSPSSLFQSMDHRRDG